MIIVENAWELICNAAKKAMLTQMIYCSLKEHKAYRVLLLENDKIIIERKSGGQNGELKKSTVERAIKRFNSNGGQPMKRRSLIEKPVLEETALVLFHPNLSWDETGDFIIEV
ncbi:MAG: hypothetical protein MH472_03455 [Bacteroidia bacterium]|nr:hypothetical protein [Bacteroidia bacterium]